MMKCYMMGPHRIGHLGPVFFQQIAVFLFFFLEKRCHHNTISRLLVVSTIFFLNKFRLTFQPFLTWPMAKL